MNRNLLCRVAVLLCPAIGVAQQPLEAIDLQAATSSYDRQNGHLVFTEVSISQGNLGISAALAEANELQFDDASWRFSGNVRIVLEEAIILADEAQIDFTGHNLRRATVRGEPATIEGTPGNGEKRVDGRAATMEYDHAGKKLLLVGNAWITEGQNEISGSSLMYDFNAETVIAGDPENQTQDVRIIIKPPVEGPDSAIDEQAGEESPSSFESEPEPDPSE